MSLTENSDQVFLPGGVHQNSKFEIWPLHYIIEIIKKQGLFYIVNYVIIHLGCQTYFHNHSWHLFYQVTSNLCLKSKIKCRNKF